MFYKKGAHIYVLTLDTLCKGSLFKTLLFSVNKHAPKVAKNFKTRSGYLGGFVHLPLGLYDHFEDHTVIASHQDWNREKLTRDYGIYLKNCEAPSSGQNLKIIGSQETNLLYLMAWVDTSQDFLSLQSRHWIAQEFFYCITTSLNKELKSIGQHQLNKLLFLYVLLSGPDLCLKLCLQITMRSLFWYVLTSFAAT